MSKRGGKAKRVNNEMLWSERMSAVKQMQYDDPRVKAPAYITDTDARFQMFEPRHVNNDIEGTERVELKPIPFENKIKFIIKPTENQMIATDDMSLKTKFRLLTVDAHGEKHIIPAPNKEKEIKSVVIDVEKEETVGGEKVLKTVKETVKKLTERVDGIGATAAPLFALTAFRAIMVTVGENQLPLEESSHEMQHIQVYLKSLFEFDSGATKNQLRLALLIYDTSDEVSPFISNSGLTERYLLSGAKKDFTLTAPLLVEGLNNIFGKKFLPPGCSITIDFLKNPSEVCLTSNKPDKLEYEIIDMSLFVTFVTPTPEAYAGLKAVLTQKPSVNNYSANELLLHSLPKETMVYRLSMPRDRPLPERMAIFFMSPQNVRGNLNTNSFWFTNQGLKSYQLDWSNGRKSQLFEASFDAGSVGDMYPALVRELNRDYLRESLPNLTLNEFKKGKFVLVIDLSRAHNAASQVDGYPKFAPLDIIFTFSEKLPNDIYLLTMEQTTKTYVISGENKAFYI